MPIASTIANKVSVLIEKPDQADIDQRRPPTSDTGMATTGISAARQLLQEHQDDHA